MKNLIVMLALLFTLNSCGFSSSDENSGNYTETDDYDTESYYSSLRFNSAYDVFNYLDGKTFKGDGLSVRFSNNAHSVYVNGTNLSNNVKISDIGVNDNDVAYATVQVVNPAGVTTTFLLLAVEGHAQLIDPNDGTVYEY